MRINKVTLLSFFTPFCIVLVAMYSFPPEDFFSTDLWLMPLFLGSVVGLVTIYVVKVGRKESTFLDSWMYPLSEERNLLLSFFIFLLGLIGAHFAEGQQRSVLTYLTVAIGILVLVRLFKVIKKSSK